MIDSTVIIMNKYERIGESIWDTYRMMGAVLVEKSALPRVERGEDDDEEESVNTGSGWTYDQDDVRSMKRRRKEFADHLKNIRKGKQKPSQEIVDPDLADWDEVPERRGPGGSGGGDQTHAQRAASITNDMLGSRGREAEYATQDAEKAVSDRENQAVKSRNRASQAKAAKEKRKVERKK